MATYKVIQDIEAEDHILGPFSFRQFVYLLIALLFGYLSVVVLIKGVGFLLVLFLPFVVFFGFLAFPFIKDQPTEVWALAKIRYFVKPRKRLWNQTGAKDLVTITAPKKITKQLTKSLNESEVKNRLKRLSETMDTRGWAIKNATSSVFDPVVENDSYSDRLIVPSVIDTSSENDSEMDIMDSATNPVASHIDNMILTNESNHKQRLLDLVNGKPSADEVTSYENIINENKQKLSSLSNLKNISTNKSLETKNNQTVKEPVEKINTLKTSPASTPKPLKSDIINLAKNDNLSLQTISKEINKDDSNKEVIISLR